MAIRRTSHTPTSGVRRPITASQNIASNAVRRQPQSKIMASMAALTPEQKAFTRQLISNVKRNSRAITAATNTANIMAKPEFLEMLPLFTQKLLITDVFGTIAMKSRSQIIPYFKVVAENTKGETKAGTIMNSPMVNRQGLDPNFTSNVIKNEIVTSAVGNFATGKIMYTPVLPGSVTVTIDLGNNAEIVKYYDKDGILVDLDKNPNEAKGYINYSTGEIELAAAVQVAAGGSVVATYQYDNETVGPHPTGDTTLDHGQYGARMGKFGLQLDEFTMEAKAHQLAAYWSIYSAFVAQNEWGTNINDMAKEAAFSEITAEINREGFQLLKNAARFNPAYNWDAAPVHNGSVVPHDYLNMFKLKLNQAASGVYQATNLTRPNRIVTGTNAASYIAMIDGFKSDNIEDTVGPYHFGKLDQFEIFVDPNYDPNEWVMACKSNDIRRNSALFGEYMPLTNTDPIGLADASVQQGYCSMYGMKVVNPDTVVSGKILGTY